MKTVLLISIALISGYVAADDYTDAKLFAQQAQSQALSQLSQLNGHETDYLTDFTRTPSQSGLTPDTMKNEASKEALRNDTAKNIVDIDNERKTGKHAVDLQSREMIEAGNSIESAESRIQNAHIPCVDDGCLPTEDDMGDDFAEGISRLGVLAGSAKDIADKQINTTTPAIFSGSNTLCRVAVAHVGNCCGKHARFLHCRADEKTLAYAIEENRARYVGTYCAHKKMGVCFEQKQSWCVFPSKLASIFQLQGRFDQLHISFGWAGKKTNAADCRGITPLELERLNFELLDLSTLVEEFKSRHSPTPTDVMDAEALSKISSMEREGKAHD